jgi:hypothetical protein
MQTLHAKTSCLSICVERCGGFEQGTQNDDLGNTGAPTLIWQQKVVDKIREKRARYCGGTVGVALTFGRSRSGGFEQGTQNGDFASEIRQI